MKADPNAPWAPYKPLDLKVGSAPVNGSAGNMSMEAQMLNVQQQGR